MQYKFGIMRIDYIVKFLREFMRWFNFFDNKTEPKHSFGRGINANLHEDEERLFEQSYEAFEAKDTLNGYELFLKSLQNFSNNISNENITIKKEDDRLLFEILQGSAKITGVITDETLYAESILVKKSSATVALKRLILERNYQFTYAYYFSDDKYIKLKLFLDNITMNPQKIFYPLREIALNADFDKEYVKSEFSDIPIEDIDHLKPLDAAELKLKYDFLHEWIDELNAKIASLPPNDNAAMQSFLLLTFLFKIDYLLVPKYDIFHKSSKKTREYFSNENSTVEAKNEELRLYINELLDMPFEKFRENFYEAKYSFDPNEKTTYEEIEIFITESLAKIRWYKNNRYNQVIPYMYQYIALYILYNYGLHTVLKRLLHTLVEVQNPDFFSALGYVPLYNKESGVFAKKAVISQIEEIILPHQNRFKLLKPFGENLNFTSLNEFSNSFYLQLKNLDFEEI